MTYKKLTDKEFRDLLSDHVIDDEVEKILREDRKALQLDAQAEWYRDKDFASMVRPRRAAAGER